MVNWSEYSKTYDLLLEFNPAYQEIVEDFDSFLSTISPPKTALDIGSGTGNYSLALLKRYPDCSLDMVEPDESMASLAIDKTSLFPNVRMTKLPIKDFQWGHYDLIIGVHSLYVIADYKSVLKNISNSIRESSGCAYLCNIGRPIDVSDWRKFIVKSIYKNHGLAKTLSLIHI